MEGIAAAIGISDSGRMPTSGTSLAVLKAETPDARTQQGTGGNNLVVLIPGQGEQTASYRMVVYAVHRSSDRARHLPKTTTAPAGTVKRPTRQVGSLPDQEDSPARCTTLLT